MVAPARGLALSLVALLPALAAQDVARWALLDALLPPTLQRRLPTLLRIFGDICQVGEAVELISSTDAERAALELPVVEHSERGRRRYPVWAAGERLAELEADNASLYVGGWGSAPGDAAGRTVVQVLRAARGPVLELDVRALFGGEYAAAAARIGVAARAVRALLRAAVGAGFASGMLHAVGFSLGAHAVGAGARAAAAGGAGRLGRLTALDAARPCLAHGAAQRWRVSRRDATFVLAVHSSAGALGLARALGHADVYVDAEAAGGGAAGLARAHEAAWRRWADSARTPLWARRCVDATAMRARNCTGPRVSVGYGCSPDTRGIFLVDA